MNIELGKCSATNLALTQVVQLRSEFEELTRGYNMPEGSDINTIKWFLKNGHRSNSLRNGFKDAMKIAEIIKEYADGCTKTTSTRKQIRVF